MITISTLLCSENGCNYIRIKQPFIAINNQKLAEAESFYDCDRDYLTDNIDKIASATDVFLLRHGQESSIDNLKILNPNCKIIIDYDDDIFSTLPYDPNYFAIGLEEFYHTDLKTGKKIPLWVSSTSEIAKQIEDGTFCPEPGYAKPGILDIDHNKDQREIHLENIKKADLITVTTERLAERFKKINSNVYVYRNSLNTEVFKNIRVIKPLNEVRIVWAGGCSHYGDLMSVRNGMYRILKKYKNVKFILVGDPDRSVFETFPDIKNQLVFERWVTPDAHPYRLATLGGDIGICPLRGVEFDGYKSTVKWMEYTAVGMATLASNVSPYKDEIVNCVDGLLYNDEEEFVELLSELIDQPKLRQELHTSAYLRLKKDYDINKNVQGLVKRLERLVKGE